ncbi:hypothetical protein [Laspinema olomoucense]|uniref:Protein kinase domain-containing protein n=1 Tax=Laspinema olomoucense D3b TaxID=2953688 RepID=A0ABT2N8A6_9CYAN|nr:hypothetical protein [Laspinema sp. D3b]MCT7978924.1 hypothetical protein [Laspinema sp. D3b]
MDRRFWKKMVGDQFNNKYHLVKFIDSGTFGGVFLANEMIADHLIRQVALKIFLVDTSQLDSQIAKLRLAIRLKHPHLLDCYSFNTFANLMVSGFMGMLMDTAQTG